MANFFRKLVSNGLTMAFVCFWLTSCNHKEPVESVSKINLVAPSGIQVARSVEQLEAKIANIFSIHLNNVDLISIEFLEAKDGYSYRAKFVNKFSNETQSIAFAGDKESAAYLAGARTGVVVTPPGETVCWCSCGSATGQGSSGCDATATSTSCSCKANESCQTGCYAHFVKNE